MMLLIVALFGLAVGDGIFVWWLVRDYHGLAAVWNDRLALSFILDALLTLAILTVHFARQPPGPVRWPWFVLFSLVGGLSFGLPFFWWINKRTGARARVT